MAEGSLLLPLITALALIGGMVVERGLLAWRPTFYFRLGLPLLPDPVPIDEHPEGEGKTATVAWEVVGDVVKFWAVPGERSAPSGLHGAVLLSRHRGRVALSVRWSPPWSYVLAAVWLAVLGALRDQLPLTLSIAVALLVGVFAAYRHFAVRAARELRWAFVQGSEAP